MTRRIAGFTLVEMLVALAVFAVLGVLAFGGLRGIISLDSGLAARSEQTTAVEFALSLIEQDLQHATRRAVRDEFGDPEPALTSERGTDLVSLTRYAAALPGGDSAVSLRRIRYRLLDGELFRDVWQQLDRTPSTTFSTRRLLDNVGALKLRYFANREWRDYWPPEDAGSDMLPRGFEILLAIDQQGTLRRTVEHPGG